MEGFERRIRENGGVTVFGKVGCPYCDKLRGELEATGVEHTYVCLDPADATYPAAATELKAATGMTTFPMMYVGRERVGGYTDFLALALTDRLAPMLATVGITLDVDF